MTTRADSEMALRAAIRDLIPKPLGKLKKHELDHILLALASGADAKKSIPEPPTQLGNAPARPIQTVLEGGVHIPVVPKPRVTAASTPAEKAELRASKGLRLGEKSMSGFVPLPGKPGGGVNEGLAKYRAAKKAEKEAVATALGLTLEQFKAQEAAKKAEAIKAANAEKAAARKAAMAIGKEAKKAALAAAEAAKLAALAAPPLDAPDARASRIVRAHVEKKPVVKKAPVPVATKAAVVPVPVPAKATVEMADSDDW